MYISENSCSLVCLCNWVSAEFLSLLGANKKKSNWIRQLCYSELFFLCFRLPKFICLPSSYHIIRLSSSEKVCFQLPFSRFLWKPVCVSITFHFISPFIPSCSREMDVFTLLPRFTSMSTTCSLWESPYL